MKMIKKLLLLFTTSSAVSRWSNICWI